MYIMCVYACVCVYLYIYIYICVALTLPLTLPRSGENTSRVRRADNLTSTMERSAIGAKPVKWFRSNGHEGKTFRTVKTVRQ